MRGPAEHKDPLAGLLLQPQAPSEDRLVVTQLEGFGELGELRVEVVRAFVRARHDRPHDELDASGAFQRDWGSAGVLVERSARLWDGLPVRDLGTRELDHEAIEAPLFGV